MKVTSPDGGTSVVALAAPHESGAYYGSALTIVGSRCQCGRDLVITVDHPLRMVQVRCPLGMDPTLIPPPDTPSPDTP